MTINNSDIDKIKERKAHEGAADFKVISSTIKILANEIKNKFQIKLDIESGESIDLLEKNSLSMLFGNYLSKEKINFIKKIEIEGFHEKSFESYFNKITDKNNRSTLLNNIKLNSWNSAKGYFFELICLVTWLKKYSTLVDVPIIIPFKTGKPIPVLSGGRKEYIWIRPSLTDTISGFKANPDIVITNSDKIRNKDTILSIVECKCLKKISSSTIRQEFGKAYDLEVQRYILVSYYESSDFTKNACRQLNLNLIDFGLYSPLREQYIKGILNLGSDLSRQFESCTERALFSEHILEKAKNVSAKLLA